MKQGCLGEFMLKRRLQHLDEEEQQKVLDYIKENYYTLGQNKIISNIYKIWNIQYKPSSIRYLLRKANHPEFLKRVDKENKIMNRWLKESSEEVRYNYADLLDRLMKKEIDQEEFNNLIQKTEVEL